MRRLSVCLCIILFAAGIAFAMLDRFAIRYVPGRPANASSASLRQPRYYRAELQSPVDSIYIVKHLRELYIFRQDTLLKIFRIALGDAPVGHKNFQGDEKTPEGLYFIDGKNPLSSCHKNLGISYPNPADRAYAKKHGKPAGGDIKIHGLPNGQGYIGAAHLLDDWTNGCVAVTDQEIDELYQHVQIGVPVLIVP